MKRKVLKVIECLCMVILITGMIVLSGSVGESLAKEPIKIGYIGALSTIYGASHKAALEISIDELNEVGGILGRPVELITEDWKQQVPLAVAAYKKLVMKDKCLLIFTEGTEGSAACAQIASRLYPSYPHLLLSFWSSGLNMDLVANEYDKYKFLFKVHPDNKILYSPEFLKETIGTKKLALLIEDIGWTELFRKGKPDVYPTMKEYFEKNGMKVVYETTTDIKEKMFLPILEKVAASGADTIYWVTAYTDTVTLVKQWAQSPARNMDLVLQSGACNFVAFWQMTGGQALGVTSMWPEIVIPFTKISKPFLVKLKAKGAGVIISTFAAYDGPWILKGAAEKVGSVNDVDKLIKAIEKGEFQRGSWIWGFDKRHEPKKGYPYLPMTLGQFQEKGRYVLVHPKKLVEITNPKDKYIHVKELRKRAGMQ